jgi:hypothetical protein
MNSDATIMAVDESIDELCKIFQNYPTYFFTENDIVTYFYRILNVRIYNPIVEDADGNEHLIIHREYPTPFRCDMRWNSFMLKSESDVITEKRKFKRGHYDLVILNPEFIESQSYNIVKGQNYQQYRCHVLQRADIPQPILLYGLEFMFSRDVLKQSRGQDKYKGIDTYVSKVLQDHQKLQAAIDFIDTFEDINISTFINRFQTLVFIKECQTDDVRTRIRDQLSIDEIRVIFGDIE